MGILSIGDKSDESIDLYPAIIIVRYCKPDIYKDVRKSAQSVRFAVKESFSSHYTSN